MAKPKEQKLPPKSIEVPVYYSINYGKNGTQIVIDEDSMVAEFDTKIEGLKDEFESEE